MTTSTISNPRNPKNPGAFSLYDVPEAGSEKSRYLVGQTSSGWAVSRTCDAAENAWTQLVSDRQRDALDVTPPFKEIELNYVGLSAATGEAVIVKRGKVRAVATKQPTASGRFRKLKASGGALLDLAFLGEDVRPDALWEALRVFVEQERPDGRTLRALNAAVCLLVLLQAGINLDARSLPEEHLR
jgi:hypothetical protein